MVIFGETAMIRPWITHDNRPGIGSGDHLKPLTIATVRRLTIMGEANRLRSKVPMGFSVVLLPPEFTPDRERCENTGQTSSKPAKKPRVSLPTALNEDLCPEFDYTGTQTKHKKSRLFCDVLLCFPITNGGNWETPPWISGPKPPGLPNHGTRGAVERYGGGSVGSVEMALVGSPRAGWDHCGIYNGLSMMSKVGHVPIPFWLKSKNWARYLPRCRNLVTGRDISCMIHYGMVASSSIQQAKDSPYTIRPFKATVDICRPYKPHWTHFRV